MRFWSIKKLINDIVTNNISEDSKFNYLLTFFIFTNISMYLMLLGAETPNKELLKFILLEGIVVITINIIAMIITYKENKKNDGLNFIERYIFFSIPITIRIFIVSIPLFILIGFIIGAEDEFSNFIVGIMLNLIYAFWIWNCFSKLTQINIESNNLEETD